jgi:hypothetical protein
VFAGAALALGVGCAVQPASNEEVDQVSGEQERIAETTAALQDALTTQFEQGTIDRAALAGPIDQVVQSFPEEARPEVQSHIANMLDDASSLASQMSPEQRADVAAHPEHVDSVNDAIYRRPWRGMWRPGWGGLRWGRGAICGLNNPWCRRPGYGWHW